MTIEVQLTQGRVAFVDESDAALILVHRWHAKVRKNGTCYAGTNIKREGRYHWVSMHRLIMNPAPNLGVDHIDGNGLNNRRINLRVCTQSENMRNRRPFGASRYLGVSHCCDGRRKEWSAQCSGKTIGWFYTEEEAARAYDKVAAEKYGEFARLNFPGSPDFQAEAATARAKRRAPETPRNEMNGNGTNQAKKRGIEG